MLRPVRIASTASASTTEGTGVSHTPCARLIPPMRSHSVVMARISDWNVCGASSLSASPETKLDVEFAAKFDAVFAVEFGVELEEAWVNVPGMRSRLLSLYCLMQ